MQYCWTDSSRNGPLQDRQVQQTVKFGGGNIMVWACFTWAGPGPIIKIEGNMDRFQYADILERGLMPTLDACNLVGEMPPSDQMIFQQDNDSKHTSKFVKEWFTSKSIKQLWWPAQSPDLNPIENLWAIVKDSMKKRYRGYALGVHELWSRLETEWKREVSVLLCQTLIESMPRRCAAVIKAKGGWTKY